MAWWRMGSAAITAVILAGGRSAMVSNLPLQPSDRSAVVLEQFEADLRPALIDFAKTISSADVDAALFVARKSLCLLDILQMAGAPPMSAEVLSDRVLGYDTTALAGKRVALVDDTLILGTSLARTHRRLAEVTDREVPTYVFCRNTDWIGDKPFIEPDFVWADLDEHRTRTFCSSEVRAFALAPRPYLTDFPFLMPVGFSDDDFALLLTSIDWKAKNITSSLQHQRGVAVYSLFASDTVLNDLYSRLGTYVADIIDLVKVRAFARTAERPSHVQFVPLVTLKPLAVSDVERLTEELAVRVMPDAASADALVAHAQSPAARQRLCQWLLSAALGHRFVSELPDGHQVGIDARETNRHFGPWAGDLLATAGERARILWFGPTEVEPLPGISAAAVPDDAQALAAEVLRSRASRIGRQPSALAANERLVTDFTEVFLNMYEDRELQARDLALELGPGLLDLTPEQAPLLYRLETGVAWSSIVASFCERYGDEPQSETINTYSLVLDICNDLGISVPVTDVRGGVVFRAWRHGEDVLFGDQELGLARRAVEGALEGTGRGSLQRLHLEKLLVILIHAGLAQQFLQPHLSGGGTTRIARVDFELKGAVPKVITSPSSRHERQRWLSDYLVERGVLAENPKKQYELGDESPDAREYTVGGEVQASCVRSDAPTQAKHLGFLVGALLRFADGVRDNAPLRDSDLIVLASCYPPRNVVAAVLAEVNIFRSWLERDYGKLRGAEVTDVPTARRLRKAWRGSDGREALFSARLKFTAHQSGLHAKLLDRCAEYLESEARPRVGPMAADQWRAYWNSIGEFVPVQEHRLVDERLPSAMSVIYDCFLSMSACEVALEAVLARGTRRRADFRNACQRHFDAYEEMQTLGIHDLSLHPGQAKALTDRIRELADAGPDAFDPALAWDYGLGLLPDLQYQCDVVVDQLDPLVNEFGRFASLRELDYVVWYDVVDSMAVERGRRGDDVERFRTLSLPGFRAMVATRLRALTTQAGRQGVLVHCWDGTLASADDQKHIYLAGDRARDWLPAVIDELACSLEAHPDVRVRAVALPCRFSGHHAYLFGRDPDIRGERFLEQMDRLTTAVKLRARAVRDENSYLGLATDELIDSLGVSQRAAFEPSEDASVTTESGVSERHTRVRGGRFGPVSKNKTSAA
jgi:hypothetical protein